MAVYLGGGTGSKPDAPPSHFTGWHFRIRRAASHEPFTGPCSVRASIAYSEQLGANLQAGGNIGEMHHR
jgi:hypothetical protein